MNLKWNDIDRLTSLTCQSMIHLHNEVEAIYKSIIVCMILNYI